jgi:mutator protein MutT
MKHFHIALALVWRDGRVLVTKRRDDADHVPGLWEFPGGKCHDGEPPPDCAVREVREETGITVRIMRQRTPITYDYPERCVTLHPFDCEVVEGEAQPLQATALRWLLPHELHIEEFPAANVGIIEDLKHPA